MTQYLPGDKSTAICWNCEMLVATTFVRCDIPLSDMSCTVRGVVAAVCDTCGKVVAVPAQSGGQITQAISGPNPVKSAEEVLTAGKQ